jgi:hypothetical protein
MSYSINNVQCLFSKRLNVEELIIQHKRNENKENRVNPGETVPKKRKLIKQKTKYNVEDY